MKPWLRFLYLVFFVSLGLIPALFVLHELNSSSLQAYFFAKIANQLSFEVEKGPDSEPYKSALGPYDHRLGYVALPQFTERLRQSGYVVASQARVSDKMRRLSEWGLFPIYREKTNGGIEVFDALGEEIYSTTFPARVFLSFEEIPDLIVNTLLFIENRELLSPGFPTRNPAFEWRRFSRAILDLGIKFAKEDHNVPGGSTLATQIEKYRHSEAGLTGTPVEKLSQMATASVRAYLDGENTELARKRIVRDYINSMPLAAIPNYGEVNGLGDGLWAWYDKDLAEVSAALWRKDGEESKEALTNKAFAYKQVLSMFISQRRPSYYLRDDREALRELTDSHLRVLAASGLISHQLKDAALPLELPFRSKYDEELSYSFLQRKAANSIRTWLLGILGLKQLYELDRLDLSLKSTLDYNTQSKVGDLLSKMSNKEFLNKNGFLGKNLLGADLDLGKVTYSVTLFERTERGNLLRVQTDNLNQPFNINEGVKLDLGSTAKLRTLVHYLELVEKVFRELTGEKANPNREIHALDKISIWVREFVKSNPKASLREILEAALQRQYSANPAEVFFTGGGQHTFENFKKEDNQKVLTVAEAMRFSVNLVFVRMMRDIVNHHIYSAQHFWGAGSSGRKDPKRKEYLSRFAEMEGKVFLRRFYKKYQGRSEDEIWDLVFEKVRRTPQRIASVFRAVDPSASFKGYLGVLKRFLPESSVTEQEAEKYFNSQKGALGSLLDRGYVARIHPLELWVAAYLRLHPNASFPELDREASQAKQEVYTWLFQSAGKRAQDTRIRIVLETEAFSEIHRAWKRVGYPFSFLTPSYATSIGSSADRPSALAELMGILINDGVKMPSIRVQELNFAAGTPFETNFKLRSADPKSVLSKELAQVVRGVLADIVQRGTAQRVSKVYKDSEGQALIVGGKTGTGDQRFEVYGAGGKLVESRAVNRTATFVFYLGERFFGTIVAYVPGRDADKYDFTSGLVVQLLKVLQPIFEPLLNRKEQASPSEN